jgi:tetratricopeptide (TPR) repeat protein
MNLRNLATGLGNLALLYQTMGAYAKAEPLYQQALQIRQKALGRQDPDAATSLDQLAGLYCEMGAYTRAESLFVYLRTADSEQIIVSINPAAQSCSVTLDGLDNATPLLVQGVEVQSGRLQMEPVSFGIFAIQQNIAPRLRTAPRDRRPPGPDQGFDNSP